VVKERSHWQPGDQDCHRSELDLAWRCHQRAWDPHAHALWPASEAPRPSTFPRALSGYTKSQINDWEHVDWKALFREQQLVAGCWDPTISSRRRTGRAQAARPWSAKAREGRIYRERYVSDRYSRDKSVFW